MSGAIKKQQMDITFSYFDSIKLKYQTDAAYRILYSIKKFHFKMVKKREKAAAKKKAKKKKGKFGQSITTRAPAANSNPGINT